MQIARLEAQIKRDMRLLRLAMESRLRKLAIAKSRQGHRARIEFCGQRMILFVDGKRNETVPGLFRTILRLRDVWGYRVVPRLSAVYVDGELVSPTDNELFS